MKAKLLVAQALALSTLLSVTPVLAKQKSDCRAVQKELFLIATAAIGATSDITGSIENIILGYERAASQGNRAGFMTEVRGSINKVNNVVNISKDELRVYLSDHKECFSSLTNSDITEVRNKINAAE